MMNKREFLRILAVTGLGLSFPSLPRPVRTPASKKKNWVWITTDEARPTEEWKAAFALMKKSGIDAVLPEVYNGTNAFYASHHLPVKDLWLERILPLAKAEGLEVHAWMWSMPCNIDEVVGKHPDWYCVNLKGESASDKPAYVPYYKFLCPSHPEVREFIRSTVTELAGIENLDGVHLDYIRYPDVILAEGLQPKYHLVQDREYPEFDYCYCDLCRRDFRNETGVDLSALQDPATSAEWRQFRYDRMTRLVNDDLIPVIRRNGKLATAAVFPNWQMVRQQWSRWNLDAALPMLYHGFYNQELSWIGETLKEEIKAFRRSVPIYSGLFVPQLNPDDLTKAIRISLDAGAQGVSLFSHQAMTPAHWQRMRETVPE